MWLLGEKVQIKKINKIKNDFNLIRTWKGHIDTNDLKYDANTYTFNFQPFEAIRYFGKKIFNCKIIISESYKKQSNLINILEFSWEARPREKSYNKKKQYFNV